MTRALAIVVLTACGRMNFDAVPSADGGSDAGDDARTDGAGSDGPTSVVAPTFVQASGNQQTGNPGTLVTNFLSDVTAGDLIVAVVTIGPRGRIPTSVIDAQGNAYTLLAPHAEPSLDVVDVFAYAIAGTTGPNSVTATSDMANTRIELRIYEYANVNTSAPYEADTWTGNTIAPAGVDGVMTDAITTTEPNELLVSVVLCNDACGATGTGFTERDRFSSDLAQDRIAPTAGMWRATASSTSEWAMGVAAFRGKPE